MLANKDELLSECFAIALPPPPNLTGSEWADANYRTERGKFRVRKAEYQRGILDAMTDPKIETVTVMASSQVGKSECELSTILYYVLQDPAHILVVLPNEKTAKEWSKERLGPSIKLIPETAKIFKQSGRMDPDNTTLTKKYPGGLLALVGAEAPAGLSSRPMRIVFGDEIDRWCASAGQDGDPMNLAEVRAITFWNRKYIWVSTPVIKGASRIEKKFLESDQRYYFVPCPHCEKFQRLVWAQVRWTEFDLEPKDAVYVCEHCGGKIRSDQKKKAVDSGYWQATAPFIKHAGFHISALYSPWLTFGEVAEKFLASKNNKELLKTWFNTYLGESFEDYEAEALRWENLMAKGEPYAPLSVPAKGLLLTCGVDVQGNRLALVVRAWGRGEESWLVYYQELMGDTNKPEVWKQLDEILSSTFTHESGAEMKIFRTSIDSSDNTNMVYNYVRRKRQLGIEIIPIKGASTPNKPIVSAPSKQDVNYQGQLLKDGVALWVVGVEAAKYTLSARLRMDEVGPGYYHSPKGTPEQYYQELCGERLVTRFNNGAPSRKWEKVPGVRNEAWDAEIYAYHAALSLRIDDPRWDWDALEKQIVSPDNEESQEEIESDPVDDEYESSWDRMSGGRAYRF
jgi:terminase, large subunit